MGLKHTAQAAASQTKSVHVFSKNHHISHDSKPLLRDG